MASTINLRKILVLFAVLLILGAIPPTAFAGTEPDGVDDEKAGIEGEESSCIERAFEGPWWKKALTVVTFPLVAGGCLLKWIAEAIGSWVWNTVLAWISEAVTYLIIQFLDLLREGLVKEPVWNDYDAILSVMLKVLLPFLFIQILVVAAHLLFSSIDPGQRARAKGMLTKLLTVLVLVAVSKPLYILLFNLFALITNSIFQETYKILMGAAGAGNIGAWIAGVLVGVVIIAIYSGIGILLLKWVLAYLVIVVLILFIRYAMIILFYIIFPFTVFLYYFEYTRNLGGNLLMKTILWLSMGPVMALIVSITVMAIIDVFDGDPGMVQSLQDRSLDPDTVTPLTLDPPLEADPVPASGGLLVKIIGLFMFLGGVVALIAVPLIMAQLLKWVGAAAMASGMMGMTAAGSRPERWRQMGIVMGGGLMMGQGPTSLVTASSMMSYMNRDVISRGDGILPSFGGGSGGGSGSGSGGMGGGSLGGGAQAGGSRRGFFGNLGRVFDDQSSEPTKYWLRSGGGGIYGTPQHSAPGGVTDGVRSVTPGGADVRGAAGSDPSGRGATGAGAGTVRDAIHDKDDVGTPQSRVAELGTSQQPSEIYDKDGKLLSADTDRYSTRGSMAAFSSKETTAGILPALNIGGRVDTAFTGFGDMGRGFKLTLFPGTGSRLSGVTMMSKGVGKLLLSMIPLSPFMPVRMVGRVLLSISSSDLPPFIRPYTYWMGQKMMGLGFRQVMMRTKWDAQMGLYRTRYEDIERQKGRLEEKKKVGKLTDREEGRLQNINSEMEDISDSVAKTMNNIGYGKTAFAQVLPENPDFQAYQKHLNIMKKSTPGLYDRYIQKSRVSGEDEQVKGTKELWDKRERAIAGELEDKEKQKEFDKVVDQAITLYESELSDELKQLKSDMEKAETPDKQDELERLYRLKRREAVSRIPQQQFYTVGYLVSSGIEDKEAQQRFLKSNEDLFQIDARGNVTRRRFLKLDGKVGEAARNLEYVFQRDYFIVLTQDLGVPYTQALERARAMNLRLYRDKDGDVYMSGYDLKYLSTMVKRDDWALSDARTTPLNLSAPFATYFFSFKHEDYDESHEVRPGSEAIRNEIEITAAAQLRATEAELHGQRVLDPDGNSLVTIGTPDVYDGDKINVYKVRQWTEAGGILKTVKGADGRERTEEMKADEQAELMAQLKGMQGRGENVGEYLEQNKIRIDDPASRDMRAHEITGFRVDESGRAQIQFEAWRHLGQQTIKDDKGVAKIFFAAPEVAGKDGLVATSMGLPNKWMLDTMSATEMQHFLLEHGRKPEQVSNMSEGELRKTISDLYDSKAREYERNNEERAEKIREDAAQAVAKRLADYEITKELVMEADGEFHIHKQEMELMQQAGLTREDVQALKAVIWNRAKQAGAKIHSLRFYNESDDINPMMMNVEGDGAHLKVNLAHIMAEGMDSFLFRADAHLVGHELSHVSSERDIKQLRESADSVLDGAESAGTVDLPLAKTALRRKLLGLSRFGGSQENYDSQLMEVHADLGRDPVSQMRLWEEQVLPGLESCSDPSDDGIGGLGDEDMTNGARISAFLSIYRQEFEKQAQASMDPKEKKQMLDISNNAKRLEHEFDDVVKAKYRDRAFKPGLYDNVKTGFIAIIDAESRARKDTDA